MKTLFFDCNMGAAGDMIFAALLELHPEPKGFVQRMNELDLPGVRVAAKPSVKLDVLGTHVTVAVQGEEETPGVRQHHSTGIREIESVINRLPIPFNVRKDALTVYGLIAGAESHVHGQPVDMVHFHEVGMLDAVTDVVGVSLLMHEIAPDSVLASPVHVGSGEVLCAHGVLPVPAPATAYILNGIPTYGDSVRGELCTPTGAALLKHFVSGFGDMPQMKISQTGYGMGTNDYEKANCIRAVLGETDGYAEPCADYEPGKGTLLKKIMLADLIKKADTVVAASLTANLSGFFMKMDQECAALAIQTASDEDRMTLLIIANQMLAMAKRRL